MFNESKYTRWYYAIIENARCQPERSGYLEKHHVIPRSLGGSNEKTNLVSLTFREHFLCHWLLTKMVIEPKHLRSMKYSMRMMLGSSQTNMRKPKSWQYHTAKTAARGIPMSEEQKAKLRLVRRSPELRARIGESQRKRLSDPAVRENLAAKKRGTKISVDHAAKLKASHFDHVSDSHREAIRRAKSKTWRITHNDGSVTTTDRLQEYARSLGVSYTLLHKLYLEKSSRPKINIYRVEQAVAPV